MIPLFSLGYAETHYKFKLPWSPLHERWPEIFLDAPSRVEPGKTWPVWLVLRDADLFPTVIHSIRIRISCESHEPIESEISVGQRFDGAFHFQPLNIDLQERRGNISVSAWIDAERVGTRLPRKSRRIFQDWNYPGLKPAPLQVIALNNPYPKPNGWWAGETHCHTWHTSSPVEFGAPVHVLQDAALALGLDFTCTTDHSYDFNFKRENYSTPANPQERWNELLYEFKALATYPLMIPGEEVSCGNEQGQNVHLLVPGFAEFLQGLGDSGRQWLRNKPELSVADVLKAVGDVPCFAAHPQGYMSRLERFIFRRGAYSRNDLQLNSKYAVMGLEFWNGAFDSGFKRGREFWIQQLLQGSRLLPIGGTDAHGDLNRFTGVRTPLFSLAYNRERLFGRVRTVIAPSNSEELSIKNIHNGFSQAAISGSQFSSDGPSLHITYDETGLVVHGLSTTDFGAIAELHVFYGRLGQGCENVQVFEPQSTHFDMTITPKLGVSYVRAECRTTFGHFAMSAATWI